MVIPSSEVVSVASDQSEAVRECSAGDQRVTEGHLSELAEFDRLIQNVLRQRQDWGGGEERLKVLAFLPARSSDDSLALRRS